MTLWAWFSYFTKVVNEYDVFVKIDVERVKLNAVRMGPNFPSDKLPQGSYAKNDNSFSSAMPVDGFNQWHQLDGAGMLFIDKLL